MNAEADRYVKACDQESEKLGSAAAARLHALQNLKLKTAVKVIIAACTPSCMDANSGMNFESRGH